MAEKSFVTLRRKYQLVDTIVTNINKDYLQDTGSNWGIFEMWRESWQNLVDEAQYCAEMNDNEIWDHYKYKFDKKPNKSRWGYNIHTFRDMGRGVNIEKVILLGVSDKRGTHFRGEKGEGELMSFLVAAQHGIKKTMFSQDWAVEVEFVQYLYSNYKVLQLNVYKTNKPIDGTVWYYESHPDLNTYIRNRDDYFVGVSKRSVSKEYTQRMKRAEESDKQYKRHQKRKNSEIRKKSTSSSRCIMMPKNGTESRLFVRGIYVREIDTLFSYNVQDANINRDRSMVDNFTLFEGIQKGLSSEHVTKKMAEYFWQAASSHSGKLEFRKTYNFGQNIELFKKAFYRVYGKKACIATETFMQTEARAIGFKPIQLDSDVAEMAQNCGVLTDKETSGFLGGYKEVQPTAKEEKLLEQLYFIKYALGLPDAPVVVASKIANVDDTVLGICVDHYTKVVIMRKAFNSKRELLKTYIHEFVHISTMAGDGTRAFTSGFENIIANLLINGDTKSIELVQEFIKK